LLLHDEDPARTFADLDHRTIMAIPGVYWMEYLRHRYRIELREIPLNYGLAQFMADRTFVQQCFLTNEPYYVRKNGGHPRTIQLSESIRPLPGHVHDPGVPQGPHRGGEGLRRRLRARLGRLHERGPCPR